MLKKLSQFIDSPSSVQNSFKKDKAHLHESFDFLALIRAWKDIAGAKLSEHTIPLKNQNGTLVILSNHSAIASELSYQELLLKEKIFKNFPNLKKSIIKITFIVDSTHFSKQYEQYVGLAKKKETQIMHPHSPDFKRLKKEAEAFFSDVVDLEIKEKMISLYIQSFRN
ncbi:MAG: DUF721 domain-containing protein [Bacteriovorax sp.]|nr:DUF721 domain-containing protein [Bacteriovorax sp.]